jgi:hypothetical protein
VVEAAGTTVDCWLLPEAAEGVVFWRLPPFLVGVDWATMVTGGIGKKEGISKYAAGSCWKRLLSQKIRYILVI